MAAKTVNVYRFDYEMDESTWVAFIGGLTNEDAGQHLVKTIGKPIKITTTGFECRLDSLSDAITSDINGPLLKKIENLKKSKNDLKKEIESIPKKKKPGRKPKDEEVEEKDEIKIGKLK